MKWFKQVVARICVKGPGLVLSISAVVGIVADSRRILPMEIPQKQREECLQVYAQPEL
jgi:hypothetical protein